MVLTQKATVAITVLAGLIVLSGCSDSSQQSGNSKAFRQQNKVLADFSEQYLDQYFVKCGDSYSTRYEWDYGRSIEYLQMKNFGLYMTEDRLTEVDEMNGVSWSGAVAYNDGYIYRKKQVLSKYDGTPDLNVWTEWVAPNAGNHTFSAKNKSGEWTFTARSMYGTESYYDNPFLIFSSPSLKLTKPTCSESALYK